MIACASEAQLSYITELSQQYIEYGDKILDMFMHRNASTYLSMVASRNYGFDMNVCYDLVGWNGLAKVPEAAKKRVGILHLAEMCDFYDRGIIDFYQIDKQVRKDFGIETEEQLRFLVKQLKEGFSE